MLFRSQCFLYRAAGDVVGMLVPGEELDSHHSLGPLADHVTGYALGALGLAAPLAMVTPPTASPDRGRKLRS